MLVDLIERLRLTTRVSQAEWCDLLNIRWSDYQKFKSGQLRLSEESLQALADRFDLSLESLQSGQVDFVDLAIQNQPTSKGLPERYSQAAFGKRRSSIAAVQFLEDKIGWRLRHDVVQKFEIPEAELLNPFGSINMVFMTDVCDYLKRRGFRQRDFHAMGLYGYEMNLNTLIGNHFSKLKHVGEVVEAFFTESVKMFEENCNYKIVKLTPTGGIIEIRTNKHVADILKTRYLGSNEVCQFRMGVAASLPMYQGHSASEIKETACEHRGDECCRYEFTYTLKNQ